MGGSLRMRRIAWLSIVFAVGLCCGCSRTTAELLPETVQRFESEGIVRKADDLQFRYTHGAATYRSGYEDKKASIIVTRQSLLIHQNHDGLIEITSRSTGAYRVNRDHDRVILHAGSGQSRRSYSFQPPDDPEGWTRDIRAVIRKKPEVSS